MTHGSKAILTAASLVLLVLFPVEPRLRPIERLPIAVHEALIVDPVSGLETRSPIPVSASVPSPKADADNKEPELSPEEKMRRRFPQPVKVGFLVGLPVLDDNDSTIGFVQRVVRTPDGKIQLIVPYGGWFGWIGGNQRLVAVPIEVVAILARQIAAVDMPRDEFEEAPTWDESKGKTMEPDEMIRIAITRR